MTLYISSYPILIACFLLGAAAMFVQWRMNPGEPGISWWFWGLAAAALGCTLAIIGILLVQASSQDPAPNLLGPIFRICASWFNCIAWVLVWQGFRCFLGLSRPSLQQLLGAAIVLFFIISASLPLKLPMAWEVGCVGVVLTLGSASIAQQLYRAQDYGLATWFTFSGLVLLLLCWCGRALIGAAIPTATLYGPVAYITMFFSIIAIMAVNMGMTLLISSRRNIELKQLATVDSLTGALNRRSFFEQAKNVLSAARRQELPLSLVMLDLDHFKSVNDRHGHMVGDQLLEHFSDLCRNNLREEDLFARYGGEEFILLLPGSDQHQTYLVMERIRHLISLKPLSLGHENLDYSVSIGVSRMSFNATELDQLVDEADKALYRAKHTGRNRTVLSDIPLFELEPTPEAV